MSDPGFRPIAELPCRHCATITEAREGTILVVSGGEGWAYCGPACVSGAGVWPWNVVRNPKLEARP